MGRPSAAAAPASIGPLPDLDAAEIDPLANAVAEAVQAVGRASV